MFSPSSIISLPSLTILWPSSSIVDYIIILANGRQVYNKHVRFLADLFSLVSSATTTTTSLAQLSPTHFEPSKIFVFYRSFSSEKSRQIPVDILNTPLSFHLSICESIFLCGTSFFSLTSLLEYTFNRLLRSKCLYLQHSLHSNIGIDEFRSICRSSRSLPDSLRCIP